MTANKDYSAIYKNNSFFFSYILFFTNIKIHFGIINGVVTVTNNTNLPPPLFYLFFFIY